MARRPRVVFPGSLHHVTARGVARRTLFADDDDRAALLASIARAVRNEEWSCRAYCLMGNHFHLLVATGRHGLSSGMHRVNTRCAQRYNRLSGVTGHVFDRRFADQLVMRPAHLFEVVRYIHLNPVRAGLCRHPAEWQWSSFRAIAGTDPAPAFLSPRETLELFGRDPATARRSFVQFVEDGIAVSQSQAPADLARPSLLELVRTHGFEGGRIAHLIHGYPQRDVAAALGISCNTFRRRLEPGTNLLTGRRGGHRAADRGPAK